MGTFPRKKETEKLFKENLEMKGGEKVNRRTMKLKEREKRENREKERER